MKIFVILAFCVLAWGHDLPSGRILGGEEVQIEDFPWQASVRSADKHRCGGAIIDIDTVLSSASCVTRYPLDFYSVRAGSIAHQAGKSIGVRRVIIHENFDNVTLDNDIAILKVSPSLTLSPALQPVELQDGNVEVPAGTLAWVSGFGVTKPDGSIQEQSSRIRAVEVEVISDESCAQRYPNRTLTSHMICARAGHEGPCKGDFGGPLVANGKLIGLASWQIGCGQLLYPNVYTKISSLNDWIERNRY